MQAGSVCLRVCLCVWVGVGNDPGSVEMLWREIQAGDLVPAVPARAQPSESQIHLPLSRPCLPEALYKLPLMGGGVAPFSLARCRQLAEVTAGVSSGEKLAPPLPKEKLFGYLQGWALLFLDTVPSFSLPASYQLGEEMTHLKPGQVEAVSVSPRQPCLAPALGLPHLGSPRVTCFPA